MPLPNVLLITLDQMRWDAICAHGNSAIATPNLDALIRGGATFSRAYSQSPVCVPARASILTGQLPRHNGVYDNSNALVDGYPTVVRELAAAGYKTQAIGKMHFRPVRAGHGFHNQLLSEELPAAVDEDDFLAALHRSGYDHVEEPHGIRHELYYVPQPSQLPERQHTTAWTGQSTCEWLAAQAGERDPFFCWTSFIKPHPPFDPPAPWYHMYDPVQMPDPIRAQGELSELTYYQRLQHRLKWIGPDASTPLLRSIKAYYYASVSFVDAWIGHILQALEENGLVDNTLVILTSDHGEYLGDHWSFGKRGFHDAAARVPLIARWPQHIPAGIQVDALVGLCDLAPTIREVAEVEASVPPDGQSLWPVINGERSQLREVLVGELGQDDYAMYLAMDDTHKLVSSVPDGGIRWWSYATPTAETTSYGDLTSRAARKLLNWIPEHARAFEKTSRLEIRGSDDREPTGRERQYARWPRHADWRWSAEARGSVGFPPNR